MMSTFDVKVGQNRRKDQNEVKEFSKNVDQRLAYGEMM